LRPVTATTPAAHPAAVAGDRAMDRRAFALVLGAIGVVALVVRLLYAERYGYLRGVNDATWYHTVANAIADGHGFSLGTRLDTSSPTAFEISGPWLPTAYHPPLFPAVLALPASFGLTSFVGQRTVSCVIGAATPLAVALVGRRIGGDRLGLVAGVSAAIYPPLVANDSVLMSESLYGLLIAATILTAMWTAAAPTWRRAAVLGAVVGLDALTRAEALLLLVLLVPFVVRRAGPGSLRRYLAAVAAALVLVAPWCVRNSLQFDRATGISTGDGAVLASANTDRTYRGPYIGSWDFAALAVPRSARVDRKDEAAVGAYLRRRGVDYARAHAGRLPVVAAARALRTWSLYPFDLARQARQNEFLSARHGAAGWASLVAGWAAVALALLGALLLRRQGILGAPLLSPLVLVTVSSAVFYGDVRFREAAEISLVLLAAVAVRALWHRLVARGAPSANGANAPAAVG
jgi:hypothetical protein